MSYKNSAAYLANVASYYELFEETHSWGLADHHCEEPHVELPECGFFSISVGDLPESGTPTVFDDCLYSPAQCRADWLVIGRQCGEQFIPKKYRRK